MFAVTGTWTMDASMKNAQSSALPRLVEGVKQNPGFIRGYWADDVDDPTKSVTFVVFETLDQARRFRQAVLENVPAQRTVGVEQSGLRVVEIEAEA